MSDLHIATQLVLHLLVTVLRNGHCFGWSIWGSEETLFARQGSSHSGSSAHSMDRLQGQAFVAWPMAAQHLRRAYPSSPANCTQTKMSVDISNIRGYKDTVFGRLSKGDKTQHIVFLVLRVQAFTEHHWR